MNCIRCEETIVTANSSAGEQYLCGCADGPIFTIACTNDSIQADIRLLHESVRDLSVMVDWAAIFDPADNIEDNGDIQERVAYHGRKVKNRYEARYGGKDNVG